MIDDKNEKQRKICQGCITGNPFLCSSFPGRAPEHAQREVSYRKKKARQVERARGQPQVFRRDEDLLE